MALKRMLQAHITQKRYFVGFNYYVESRLTPIVRDGAQRPPKPNSVRKVLTGERESKRLLLDIFQNGTDLMDHPCVGEKVKRAFAEWRKTGLLPADYGEWKVAK